MEYLYKYGRINDYSAALFSKSYVWFSAPSELNDPFECRPWYTFEGNPEQIVASARKMLQTESPDLTSNMTTAQAVALFLEGRHRDPEAQKRAREVAAHWLAKVGLYCLSRVRDNILMWSHYADQHRGYCLEFEATDHTYMFGDAHPVSYSDDYPSVEFYTVPSSEQVHLSFLSKYRGWSYEQEWRVIDTRNGFGLRSYPPELLRGVIFGLRMPDSDKTRIREWMKQRGHSVKFYECRQDDRRFQIDIKQLE
ncbi:MAG: DUF2971 domain-containing protein [Nitrospira sp.]|nr:MAG: DUF2971 domain-containing protein [Nitrospira sp.]